MPPEISALLDKPLLLAMVLAVGAVLGMAAERIGENANKAKWRKYWEGRRGRRGNQGKNRHVASVPSAPNISPIDLAVDQLRIVMQAKFNAKPLLNRPERRLLAVIDKVLIEESAGWRTMGQVSLGEILGSHDHEAYLAINSKRIDLLIVDAHSMPVCAVEFQGTGHHLASSTAARDAVKKEALRSAGIALLEVVSGDTPAEMAAKIRKLIGAAQPSQAVPLTPPPRQSVHPRASPASPVALRLR